VAFLVNPREPGSPKVEIPEIKIALEHHKAKTSRREAKLAIAAGENAGGAIRACFAERSDVPGPPQPARRGPRRLSISHI